jgi:hypothetical protein
MTLLRVERRAALACNLVPDLASWRGGAGRRHAGTAVRQLGTALRLNSTCLLDRQPGRRPSLSAHARRPTSRTSGAPLLLADGQSTSTPSPCPDRRPSPAGVQEPRLLRPLTSASALGEPWTTSASLLVPPPLARSRTSRSLSRQHPCLLSFSRRGQPERPRHPYQQRTPSSAYPLLPSFGRQRLARRATRRPPLPLSRLPSLRLASPRLGLAASSLNVPPTAVQLCELVNRRRGAPARRARSEQFDGGQRPGR